MVSKTMLLVACLLLLTVPFAPAAAAAPEDPLSGKEVCVPGFTLCCTFYDDGDITPAFYCL